MTEQQIYEDFELWKQENDRRIQEHEKSIRSIDRVFKKLEESLKKIGVEVGGISNNIGYHAEQFFQNVFEDKLDDDKLEFGGIKYDEVIPNLGHKSKKWQIEFDIALVNGDSVALIETKNRIHPNFVKELAEERIEKFRKFFPEFEDYDVYLGIAGFSFSDEVLAQASKYGVGIVRQVGDGVEVEANNLRAY